MNQFFYQCVYRRRFGRRHGDCGTREGEKGSKLRFRWEGFNPVQHREGLHTTCVFNPVSYQAGLLTTCRFHPVAHQARLHTACGLILSSAGQGFTLCLGLTCLAQGRASHNLWAYLVENQAGLYRKCGFNPVQHWEGFYQICVFDPIQHRRGVLHCLHRYSTVAIGQGSYTMRV